MLRTTAAILLPACVAACGAGAPATSAVSGEAASADGVTIRYEVHGTGEPALVLLHGWTNSRAIWGEHPHTLARTHRVVALDLAGHGESGADRTEWSIDAFGQDVVAVVDQLALERVVLVGFSMGAAVALEAAERMPDRVLGIVFVDMFHDPEQRSPAVSPEQIEAAFRAGWGDTAFLRAFAFTPDAPDSLLRYVAASMPAQPHEHWFAVLREMTAWQRDQLLPTLQRIDAPVAAINTTRLPTNVEAMRRYVPSFTLDTLDGVGHAGILLQRVADFDARLLAIVERLARAPQ